MVDPREKGRNFENTRWCYHNVKGESFPTLGCGQPCLVYFIPKVTFVKGRFIGEKLAFPPKLLRLVLDNLVTILVAFAAAN